MDWCTRYICNWNVLLRLGNLSLLHTEFFMLISCYDRMMLFGIEFSPQSRIDFLSRTAFFQRNSKVSRCNSYRFNRKYTVFTSSSHDHNWSYEEEMRRFWLDEATVAICLNSLAPHWSQVKKWELFLLHQV